MSRRSIENTPTDRGREESIHCLPAGVHLEHYSANEKRVEGDWKFIYHGRLDKNRGVLALPMMVQKLKNKGFDVKLTLVGEGDASNALRQMSECNPSISVLQRVPREKIPELSFTTSYRAPSNASNFEVWRLASPLKRSEYLAAGLLVYGIDHQGHRLDHGDRDWFKFLHKIRFTTMSPSGWKNSRHFRKRTTKNELSSTQLC